MPSEVVVRRLLAPPNATGRYIPPQDLAHHLTCKRAVLRSPLVLPLSNLHFSL
ncbi:hypothetical protein L0F63_001681, partial [Massospora cicadina]